MTKHETRTFGSNLFVRTSLKCSNCRFAPIVVPFLVLLIRRMEPN